MRTQVLFLPALLCPLAIPAAAQCETTFQYFDQSIAPVFEPSVVEFALFDRDGAGPQAAALTVAGNFFDLDGQSLSDLVTHDPETDAFSQLTVGTGSTIVRFATSEDGRLALLSQEGLADFEILQWNGSAWITLATLQGDSFGGGGIYDIFFLPDGSLLAGGAFASIEGVVANKVARWDGTSWSPMGAGLVGSVDSFGWDPSGQLLAGTRGALGGPFVEGLARFDGSAWQPAFVGTEGVAVFVNDFKFLADGRLAATGLFDFPSSGESSCVAIWDGLDWTLAGTPLPPITSSFPSAGAIEELPGGDLVVGGNFSSIAGVAANGLARWDGSSWSELLPPSFSATVSDLLVGPGGDLWIGGKIDLFSSIAGGLARLIPDCKAEATSYGVGGSTSAGVLELAATNLPWTGTVFEAELGSLSSGAIAFSLLGFQPDGVPLASLTPEGSPDSTLLLVPDLSFFESLPASAGSASLELPLPANPSLAGVSLYLQGLIVELVAGGGLLLTTSNGLDLLVGQF